MTKYKAGKPFSLEDIIDFGKDLSTFGLRGYPIIGNKVRHFGLYSGIAFI